MKTSTTFLYAIIIYSVFRCASLFFNNICNSSCHLIVKFFQDVRCYSIPHFAYWLAHLFFFTNLFLHNIPNVLNGIYVGKFPDHSRRGDPLHSRNVQVLLELWHGARSCIKIYLFFGATTHSHESVFRSHNNGCYCRVWRKQNEKHHAKCIQTTVKSPVSVQI